MQPRPTVSRATRRCTSTCRSSTSTPPRRAGAAVVLVPGPARALPGRARRAGSASRDHRLVLGAVDPHAARAAREARRARAPGAADDPLRRRGLPDEVPAPARWSCCRTSASRTSTARPRPTCARGTRSRAGRASRRPRSRSASRSTDVEVFAVREDGTSRRRGEVGELYVRGPTVMQGYWGDAERTARTLLREWDGGPGRGLPVYRTGDLAHLDENGDWIFLGRRDSQIKSRGYRIELGDIEAIAQPAPRRRRVRGRGHPGRGGDEPDQGVRRRFGARSGTTSSTAFSASGSPGTWRPSSTSSDPIYRGPRPARSTGGRSPTRP